MIEAEKVSARRLPDGAELSDLFRAYPVGVRELLVYHDRVLRHPAPLTVAETFGFDESIIRSAVHDPGMSLVPVHMRPVLRFVEKLTRSPASIRKADRDAVFAAGWSEEALYYAVLTCSLFNAMNRIVDGMGIVTSPEIQARQKARHQRAAYEPVNLSAYEDYGRKAGLFEPDTGADGA